ncbi:MAG TPA: putative lipid II flippase FtsW [Thermoleophilia bacterium]|nr:putative lipid II flippase FtsW [Thermoleophilia bacterium]HQJ97283.1 putative lipid II flippase FtsW [Thermoleophilia bacterium]
MSGRGSKAQPEPLEPAPWVNASPERRAGGDRRRAAERRSAARRRDEVVVPERRRSERRAGERRAARPLPPAPGPGQVERRVLVLATVLLLLYGLVMAYSASTAQAYFTYGSASYLLARQLVFAVIGVIAMIGLSRVDYGIWRRFAGPLYVLAVALCVLALVPGIGMEIRGARRWIGVAGQSLQPSEIAKLAVVCFLAASIARAPQAFATGRGFARLVALGILPFAIIVGLLQKDLGTTLVMCVGAVAVLVAGGARWRHLIALATAGPVLVGALIVVEPYRMERLVSFVDPWAHAQTSGFQATQSLLSIASGRVFGVGLGNSVQKFGYLPDQTTDMITAIIGEELGLVGLLVLIGLYVFLAWAAYRVALTCRERFGKLLAVGIASLIVGQAFINIGAALSVVPLTGVPLPLVSLGGTSLVVVLAAVGILLNIATNRRSHIVVSARRGDGPARRRRDGRTSVASARGRG